jgi:hypothetical protein
MLFFTAIVTISLVWNRVLVSAKGCIGSADEVEYINGAPSVTLTLIKCLKNISDPLAFPGYFYSPPKVFWVDTQVAINNLITVSEVENSVTFDFFFRVNWVDTRLKISDLANALNEINPEIVRAGFDISQIVGVPDISTQDQPGIWYPDLFFPEASVIDSNSQLLRYRPDTGKLEWSRHIIITLLQSTFEYQHYPMDRQTIVMRYFSYGLNTSFLRQRFFMTNRTASPVVLFKNFEFAQSFKLNPMWSYVSGYGRIVDENNGGSPPRIRSSAQIFIEIERKSTGVVLRLGIPILLCAVLGALTFWASIDSRVDSCVTLLLAVSALYIVIFQSVPMLGYLTTFDEFTLSMFIILFVCSVVHSLVLRLDSKREANPARDVFIRVIEAFHRICLIPVICFVYAALFGDIYELEVMVFGFVCVSLFFLFICFREIMGLRKRFLSSIDKLNQKIDNFDKSTAFERLLFNIIFFGKLSTSTSFYHEARGSMAGGAGFVDVKSPIFLLEMKKLEQEHASRNSRLRSASSSAAPAPMSPIDNVTKRNSDSLQKRPSKTNKESDSDDDF